MEVDETTPARRKAGSIVLVSIVLAAAPFSLLYLQTNVQNSIEFSITYFCAQQHALRIALLTNTYKT